MSKSSDWVLAQPWAITEEALGVILAIAERRNESPQAVETRLGRPLDNSHAVTVRDGVAIVPVVGPIARYADYFTEISGATAIETLARDFRQALDDRSVRAIVLNVDSPGGTVAGVSEFAAQVKAARGVKPVVAYVGSQAASAGYWIASAADSIVADSTAMLGSIGVVMGMRPRKASDPIEIVSSQSPRKRPNIETEAGKAQIQATADDLGDLFVDAVADHRGVTRDTVLSDFGQGGSFVASKAVAAGMADAVGSLEGVIASLARGEMPCPPRKSPRPSPKAGVTTKEPAMSEQQIPPVAGDPAMTAAEATELRRQLAEARQAKAAADALAADAIRVAIEARADAFLGDVVGKATATAYAQGLRRSFVLAASDDHAHPVAGSPTARVDALRETVKAAPNVVTKGRVAAGEGSRPLGQDPADEELSPAAISRKVDDDFVAKAREYGTRLNGKK